MTPSPSSIPSRAFDAPVADGGYRWWYLDAIADDGQSGLTLIAFVGSVFSPYYARARRRGVASAANHVAINLGLYTAGSRRWCMTERDQRALMRSATRLRIGPSSLEWRDNTLDVMIDEVGAPIPARLRGRLSFTPTALHDVSYVLDSDGRHAWAPLAPLGRIAVEFDSPSLHWSGDAYLDSNAGSTPVESAFESWNWSRAMRADGSVAVFYDTVLRDRTRRELALSLDTHGQAQHLVAPPLSPLETTPWRMTRTTRSDNGTRARVIRTLEDGPFYTRSVVESCLDNERVLSIHESVSLRRFANPLVQWLLPFRMPRRCAA
jgi:carotenoid 1,2-hydratase